MEFLKKNKKIAIFLGAAVLIGGVGVAWMKLKKPPRDYGTVEIGRTADWQPITVTYDLKYSFRDFTNNPKVDIPDGTIVYASVFYQETPNSHIFREKMKKVTFVLCNLDNVVIPPDNTVMGGSHKRFQVQNDLRDWLIDENNKPIEVMDKEYWESQGYSVDPKDIPDKPLKDISEIKKVK
jgi:hypothetical protein